MQNEPVVNTAVVGALVVAVIAVLIAFGAPITEEQKVTVLGLVGVTASGVISLVQRRKVTPAGRHTEPETEDAVACW